MQLATLRRLAALMLLVAAPAAMAQHTTGTVTMTVFGNGYYGAALGVPAAGAFTFNGLNGLFEGQLMVGLSANQVAGQPYAAAAVHEWTTGAPPAPITPPAPFNQAFQAGPFTDGAPANPNPIGLSVTSRTYSSNVAPNNDFVIVELDIQNTGAVARNNVFIGMFADWDVGPGTLYEQDLAGYDATTKLLYVFNTVGTNAGHYGVAVIGASPVSGYTDNAGAGNNPTEPQIYAALSAPEAISPTGADRRTVIGSGPFNIGAGATVTVRFAYVGGSSAADVIANAAAAQALFPTVATEGTPNANGYALSSARPNPVVSSTDLTVTLPTAQAVRVAVYDVTGREVAVLVDEARGAGAHQLTWDASAVPSGVYLVRMSAGAEMLSQTISVAR